jgi:hypothetical protein
LVGEGGGAWPSRARHYGEPASPVADALVTRGTPFVFATGYGDVPEPYRGRPTLTKPFQMDGLKQMLQSALR